MHSSPPPAQLSPREHQVLKLLANEHSNREIAELLFVNVRSIEKYRALLREKLGCSDLEQLIACARKQQLID